MTGLSIELSDELLDRLADELAERVAARLDGRLNGAPDAWMTSDEAAQYIGRSRSALHKLTAARQIPFSQDGPGAKCFFRRSDLDRWMAAGGG